MVSHLSRTVASSRLDLASLLKLKEAWWIYIGALYSGSRILHGSWPTAVQEHTFLTQSVPDLLVFCACGSAS